jgi:transcriptional regulator with XRE-family HTH domain
MTPDNGYKKTLGDKIKIIRTLAGLTQDEMGQSLNLTGSAISLVESGKRGLNPKRMKMVERLYGVPQSALISDTPMDADDIQALQNLMALIKRKVAGGATETYKAMTTMLAVAAKE